MSLSSDHLATTTAIQREPWVALGDSLGLTDFDPITVNWDLPTEWKKTNLDGAIMNQGAGYALVLGFGALFTALTMAATYLEARSTGAMSSEHFNTAGRNVKTGLTASVIVSQWTWAATLLQSSNQAWLYGISGPFWYAAGASIQVLLFGVLAIEVKRKASNAHTFLEMVDVRWGKVAHIVFTVFAFMTNVLVSSMLLLGGTSVMNAVAGTNIHAMGMVFPVTVIAYTSFGGLKATFFASYIHTAIIFAILVTMVTAVYGVNFDCTDKTVQCDSLGSAGNVWERLTFIANLPSRDGTTELIYNAATQQFVNATGFHQGPVKDNRGGSFLTMMSWSGLQFGIINTIGNFGTVFVDQSYWQSAIAAKPSAAHKGYLLGGLVWFTIPFALATSLGLAGVALNVKLDSSDAGAGLVPPAAAIVLLGTGGGVAVVIMLLMAIISTGSAECIAVSSLCSYDIYRKYIKPDATGQEIVNMSRYGVVVYGCLMAAFNSILNEMGLNLGWVYNFMGILIGGAVPPIAMLLLWKDLPAIGAVVGACSGTFFAVIAWLSVAAGFGPINLDTTGELNAQLAGNMTAIGVSAVICVLFGVVMPQNYDFSELNKGIKLVEDTKVGGEDEDYELSDEFLLPAKAYIMKYGVGGSIFLLLIWPLMSVPWGVFSKSIWDLWASVAFMWGYAAAFIIIFLPIYEVKDTLISIITGKEVAPAKTSTKTEYDKTQALSSA